MDEQPVWQCYQTVQMGAAMSGRHAELPGSQLITKKTRRTGVDGAASILSDVEQPAAENRTHGVEDTSGGTA